MERDVTGAPFVYAVAQLAGAVLGALTGLVCYLDGCTANRIWQFALGGAVIGAAWAAYTIAIATGGGSGDPGRPDVVSGRDGRE